jgi:hypothetical protein
LGGKEGRKEGKKERKVEKKKRRKAAVVNLHSSSPFSLCPRNARNAEKCGKSPLY